MDLKLDQGFQFENIWVKLTRYWESNWQFDSLTQSQIEILRVKLTIWLSIPSQFHSNILQLLGIPGRILVPPMTQFFRSKWLHFFFQCWYDSQAGRLCAVLLILALDAAQSSLTTWWLFCLLSKENFAY